MSPPPRLLRPDRLRTIEKPFAWIPFRLLKDGLFADLDDDAKLLYLFLCLAADRQGLSFYGESRIQSQFQLPLERIHSARNELIQKELVAYDGRLYQVLALPTKNHATSLPNNTNPEPRTSQPESIGSILKRLAQTER